MLARRLRRCSWPLVLLAVLAVVVLSAWVMAPIVSAEDLGGGLRQALADSTGLVVVGGALLLGFGIRAAVWCRLVPGLDLGQSLAAVHVALAGNHLLPLRLGEPLRIVSAVVRAGVNPALAAASTVFLRSADMLVLIGLGLLTGPSLISSGFGRWQVAGIAVLGAVFVVSLGYVARRTPSVRHIPGPFLLAATTLAWLCEAVAVWQTLRWFGVELSATQSVLVLAAAVSSQLVAITPGGVGTYEAAASAALVSLGVDVETALTAAIGLHLVKTTYSLGAGAVAAVVPRPSLLGRLRLPDAIEPKPKPKPGPGPVVLFLPGVNEADSVGRVVARTPDHITVNGRRRPVEVYLIDDGSTDDTAAQATAAGATVISHGSNRGLGAAVRTGLTLAAERDAAAIAFCDADGEYDPAELAALVTPILTGQRHYVVGSRFSGSIERMLPHRRLGNRLLTVMVRFVTQTPITDGQSGYRALSAPAAAAATIAHDYNYAQVLTVELLAAGFDYCEVPISYSYRVTGRSFIRIGPYLRHVVPTLWRQLNQTNAVAAVSGHSSYPDQLSPSFQYQESQS